MAAVRSVSNGSSSANGAVVVALDPAGALGQWSTTDRIAIAIPDHTRPLNIVPPLTELLQRISTKPKIVIGLGLHRPMTEQELSAIKPFQPIQHNPDDCVPTDTIDGVPGYVSKDIASCDWCISVGIAELHQYAGFSGGHKGVAVGCGGRETILALHHRDRVTASGVRLGSVTTNPFRRVVDDLGEAARCRLALVYVPGCKRWLFGEPKAVIRKAVQLVSPWSWIQHPANGAILRVPPAKGKTLYQASRAATYLALSPHPPVKKGGTLILDAPLQEGLGAEKGFVANLQAVMPPWQSFLQGEPPKGAGAQRAVMLALLAKDYHLELHGCYRPERFKPFGIRAFSSRPTVQPGWLEINRPFSKLPQWKP